MFLNNHALVSISFCFFFCTLLLLPNLFLIPNSQFTLHTPHPSLTLSLSSTAPIAAPAADMETVVLFIFMHLWVLLVSWFFFCFFPFTTYIYYHHLIPLFMLRAYLWEFSTFFYLLFLSSTIFFQLASCTIILYIKYI